MTLARTAATRRKRRGVGFGFPYSGGQLVGWGRRPQGSRPGCRLSLALQSGRPNSPSPPKPPPTSHRRFFAFQDRSAETQKTFKPMEENMESQTKTTNPPVYRAASRQRVPATVFMNKTRDGKPFPSVSISRFYKTEKGYVDTTSFSRRHLGQLAEVLGDARSGSTRIVGRAIVATFRPSGDFVVARPLSLLFFLSFLSIVGITCRRFASRCARIWSPILPCLHALKLRLERSAVRGVQLAKKILQNGCRLKRRESGTHT